MSSEEYKKAISNTIRETKAEIQFDFVDTTAKEETGPSFPTQAVFSKGSQILNDNTKKSIKIATLEKGFWKLDGTYMNLGYKDISNEEIGFVSDVISNDAGVFETPPIIVFNFTTTHSSIGLTLFFDDLTNNYAKKMRIKFYNDTTLLSDEVVENNKIRCIYTNRVENYSKIEIEFLESSLPHRRIRFLDIIFGIIQIYEDEQIVNCNLTREFNPFSENIPSHELSFEIDNLAKEFNLINPSGVYAYLQKRQLVTVRMGVVLEDKTTEFVDMGKYYLNEWKTKNLIVTLKAKDLLGFLEEITYSNSAVQSKSLKEFAVEILTYAGITNYVLDESLNNIVVNTSIAETSIKELLKQIAIAGNCTIFVDRSNRIKIIKCEKNPITSRLPSEYQEVEYIESSGTQYINTGFIPNNNTRLTVDFEIDEKVPSYRAIFGARESSLARCFSLFVSSTNAFYSNIGGGGDTYSFSTDLSILGRHTADANKNVMTIDGISYTHTAMSFQNTTTPIYLCASNDDGKASFLGDMKLYSCQIYDNGTLVRNFVPCYRTADNVAGLYDLVNNAFYENAGTGIFTMGTEINTEINKTVLNSITLANMYNVPNISLDELINRVKISYFVDETSMDLVVASGETDGKEKSVSSIFINSAVQAQVVGEYLLNLYQKRTKYKIDWRQDLDIDINEKVNIEDDFSENNDVVITKQEFKYAGYLSGSTEGRVI